MGEGGIRRGILGILEEDGRGKNLERITERKKGEILGLLQADLYSQ